jgi:hypothetical protein
MWDEGERKSIAEMGGRTREPFGGWEYNTRCDNHETTNKTGRMRRPVSDSTILDENRTAYTTFSR